MPVERQAVLNWLCTAEGYLHAVSQMLEDDQPCQQVLQQLNAVQSAIEAASSQLLRLEVERCLQAIRDNPCPEQRCQELAHLANLYPLAKSFPVKFYETLSR